MSRPPSHEPSVSVLAPGGASVNADRRVPAHPAGQLAGDEAAAPPPDATAALSANATLLAVANIAVGALNYGFGLALSFVLPRSAYVVAVAGNSLLVVVGSAAISSAGWALAHRLAAGPRNARAHAETITAALVLAALQGLVLAVVAALLALRFAAGWESVAIALGSVLGTLGVVVQGVTQGLDRFRLLALLVVGEVVLKLASGLFFVRLGGGAAGALAGTAVGAMPLVVVAIRWALPAGLRFPRATLVSMFRTSVGMVAVQGLMALVLSVDILVAAASRGSDPDASAYQFAGVLGRAPIFLAAAVAAVYFPSIARRPDLAELRRDGLLLMLRLTAPVIAVLATVPPPLLARLSPAGYDAVARYLPIIAAAGLFFSATTLVSSWLCAAERYARCAAFLAAGLAVDIGCVLVGEHWAGLLGVAFGSLAGSAAVAALLLVSQADPPDRYISGLWRRYASLALATVVLVPLLVLARGHLVAWLVVAGLTCCIAGAQALRMTFHGAEDPAGAARVGVPA
jgi:O-antigen/teichoic acid export membrane protein